MKAVKNKKLAFLIDVAVVAAGTAVYGAGVYFFTAPADIAPGGVIGIATVVNKLFNIPIGVVTLGLNIPIIILGTVYLGKKLIAKTILSLFVFTATVDYIYPMLPHYSGDRLMASLFGGALIGAGLGVVYTREATTGGMDIVNWLIQRKIPYIKIGSITLLTDAAVFITAAVSFKNIDAALYSGISVFVSTKVMDLLIYGMAQSKLLFIVTNSAHPISEEILKLGRGVTRIKAVGAYSGTDKDVIMCAAAKNQYYRIKRIVTAIDPKAFIIITNAGEVLGEGFMPLAERSVGK